MTTTTTTTTPEDTLLRLAVSTLASRTWSLSTEFHRLSNSIPPPLLSTSTSSFPFLFSLDYFTNPEFHESSLSPLDRSNDEEFLRVYGAWTRRFYSLLVGFLHTLDEWNRLSLDVSQGRFVSHSNVEQVMMDVEMKQTWPEAMAGLIACGMVMDKCIKGDVREKAVVAFFRGNRWVQEFDRVAEMCREEKKWEGIVRRLGMDGKMGRVVVGRLMGEDVYGHGRAWPATEHRSSALGNQAAMVFSVLWVAELMITSSVLMPSSSSSAAATTTTTTTSTSNATTSMFLKDTNKTPGILSHGRVEMREIVDKFFNDGWVVAVTPLVVVDLEVAWAPYPAASLALKETVGRAMALAQANTALATRVQRDLDAYLTRGVLTERFVTEKWDTILDTLREANVALRWRMLHERSERRASLGTNTTDNKNRIRATSIFLPKQELLSLLLGTAQLELVFKEAVRRVLDSKAETWATCRAKVTERMRELAQYFSGTVPLARGVARDEELMTWLESLAQDVANMEYLKAPTAAGQKLRTLIEALEEVEKYEGVESSLQVREFLADSRSLLDRMLRTVGVRDELVATIDVVSDAWYMIGDPWDDLMRDALRPRVEADPQCVVALRAAFIKLSSVLDVALVRLAQCESPDVESVAEYWSRRLLERVRIALVGVVPATVFALLDAHVVSALDNLRLEVDKSARHLRGESRLPLEQLGVLAASDARYRVAAGVYRVASLVSGVVGMGKLQLGVVAVQPAAALSYGMRLALRKRLVDLYFADFDVVPWNTLSTEAKAGLIEMRIIKTKSLRRAWSLVLDYCFDAEDVNGERVWNDEVLRACSDNETHADALVMAACEVASFSVSSSSGERGTKSLLGNCDVVLDLFGLTHGLARADSLLRSRAAEEITSLFRTYEALNVKPKPLALGLFSSASSSSSAEEERNLAFAWVESVRVARKSYYAFDKDIQILSSVGKIQILRMRLFAAKIKREACNDTNSTSASDARLDPLPPSDLPGVVSASHAFLIISELSKRATQSGKDVDSGAFYEAGVGLAYALGNFQGFRSLVVRDVHALALRAAEEQRAADESLVFGFGAQKVSKVAYARLHEEVSLFRLIAWIRGEDLDLESQFKLSPTFRIGGVVFSPSTLDNNSRIFSSWLGSCYISAASSGDE